MRYRLLSIICSLLIFILITACGRRGDPVPVAPTKEPISVESQEGEDMLSTDKKVLEEKRVIIPPSPTGLVALWTGKTIILTWDDIIDRDIKGYNVYRSSEDNGFKLIGKTVTPAFTDRDVMSGKRYIYKVTAVAEEEGLSSKEIEVVTYPK